MSKRISFLIPTFNRADYIAEAIRSITQQMGGDDEIIVVDDGSSDATPAVLSDMGDRITAIRQDNAGKSVALNRALDHAGGAYIWICDDDDLLCPDAVATLSALIEESRADFVFGRYSRFAHRKGAKIDLGMAHWPLTEGGSPTRHILEDAFVMHNATLARRSLYDRVGPFDPSMLRAQDYDMFVRCSMRGRAAFTDRTIFEQRKHEGARGPASMLHSFGQSSSVWQEYDARIFRHVYDSVPVAFFEGMFKSSKTTLAARAGLMQRATVMARHGLWAQAIQDWQTASDLADTPLTKVEQDIGRRAMAGKHGFVGALDTTIVAELRNLERQAPLGAAIVRQLIEGLLWRFRDPEESNRAMAWQLISKLNARSTLIRCVFDRIAPALDKPSPYQIAELSEIALLP